MPAQGQRRLVIDANVARSSGETEHPASRIVWVNPVHHSETPIDWLRRGAKSEVGRQLGT